MGATGWIAGFANAFPAALGTTVRPVRRPNAGPRALERYLAILPLLRWDADPALRPGDQAGAGGSRLLRRPCPAARASLSRRPPMPTTCGPPSGRSSRRSADAVAARADAAVDSHTEGMPTRVVTSGVGRAPGPTMAERRLYLMKERDDLRTLLMHEPRGHGAMSGADPAAIDPARLRLRRRLHRGVRVPADVRARDDGHSHRARRDGHGRR